MEEDKPSEYVLNFFKERHLEQIRRRESFLSSVGVIVNGLALAGAVLAFLLNSYTPSNNIDYNSLFWFSLLVSSCLYGLSIYQLYKSFRVPRLEDIETSDCWLSYYKELVAENQGHTTPKSLASNLFAENIISTYSEAEKLNTCSNDLKGKHLEWSQLFLLATLAASSIIYAIQKIAIYV
ncbi:hypothetical protein F9L16_07840 [Agarivorans sp. B2Z047]|uniref:hypothetical protein n=1 Tax=Agarivorans sp. B2Z047 TaxID=2652721 RepID=UPI00128B380F|nr:hypothetical protein [Agarivorans sp. B2Z047]MPW28910.1 hypothetical protein [Agarivorans sp. B2Z047]UQN41467.1 hypothetical protein LQZ07_17045 [Agarivorans sp. B2Z047]